MNYGEEDDDIFEKDTSNKKSKKDSKKKKKAESIFADYDEFAHLLEGDLYEGDKKLHKHTGPRTGNDFKKRHGRGGHQMGGKRRRNK